MKSTDSTVAEVNTPEERVYTILQVDLLLLIYSVHELIKIC